MTTDMGEYKFPLQLYSKESQLGEEIYETVHVYKLKDEHEPTHVRPKRVAVKTVITGRTAQKNENVKEILKCEFDNIEDLRHKNIAEFLGYHLIYSTEHSQPQVVLVTELYNLNLGDLLKNRGRLSSDETSYLIEQVLQGLAYLHSNNVIHGDIRPENVLLVPTCSDGDPDWSTINMWDITVKIDVSSSKLCDFGLKSCSQSKAETSLNMAPEQKFNGDGCSLDMYSVEAIAWELMTGSKSNGHEGDPKFDGLTEEFQMANPAFLSFLRCTLHNQEEERMSAKELLKHEFITDCETRIKEHKQELQIKQLEERIERIERRHQAELAQIRSDIQNFQAALQTKSDANMSNVVRAGQQVRNKQQSSSLHVQDKKILLELGKVTGNLTEKNDGYNNDLQSNGKQDHATLGVDKQTFSSLSTKEQIRVNEYLKDASIKGDVPAMASALEEGADVNYHDVNAWTPLLHAAKGGHVSAVKFLIKNCADIDANDNAGQTALWLAAGNNHEEIVHILLDSGEKIDKADRHGRTPLIEAAFRGNASIVKVLLEAGANINWRDGYGTALENAKRYRKAKTVRILQDWKRRNPGK